MLEIVSSILTNSVGEARELISRCEGVLKRTSVDIIDGKFADNKTITPDQLLGVDSDLSIDYHLMVIEPVNWIERCVRGQADRIIGQIEHMSDQAEFVGKVQEVGIQVGLAIDLDTPVTSIDPVILTNLDVVLVMSVRAGFGGQKFQELAIEKVKELDEIRQKDKTPFKIHVDGGVNFDNINKIANAGVDEISIGRLLFKGGVSENVKKFQKMVEIQDTNIRMCTNNTNNTNFKFSDNNV